MTPRTYLFVPATRLDRVPKAHDAGADVVIVDLEDAVGAADKASARAGLLDGLDDRPVHVRINGGELTAEDLAVLTHLPQVVGVMVPKVESAGIVRQVRDSLPQLETLIALIETPRGIVECKRIAELEEVDRLALGSVDYAAALGVAPSSQLLVVPRSQLAIAAAAGGKAPPIDGPFLSLDDAAGLEEDCRGAAALGMGAKLCIHPRQVEVAATVFDHAGDRRWAEGVLAEAGRLSTEGAFQFEGQLVDEPVLARARRIIGGA